MDFIKKNYLTGLVGLVLLGVLVFFYTQGVIHYDEGYILNSGLNLVKREIPYKDYDVVYTPISFFAAALSFKIFGISVLAGRIAALVVSLFSILAIYLILKALKVEKKIILLSILFFIAWGPAHINFVWPTMFALCFFLYTLLFFILGIQKKKINYFFFAGVFTILTFLSKQNFGAGLFGVSILLFPFLDTKEKLQKLFYYFFGVLAGTVITYVILALNGAFIPFLQNLYIHTFLKIFVEKTIDTPFLYEGSLISKTLKLVFYTSPVLISLAAAWFTYKKNKKLSILAVFVTIFYLLGVRPVTDYDHVVALIAFSSLSYAVAITYSKGRINVGLKLIFFGMAALGFYTAYFSPYYKWEPPLKYDTQFAADPRLLVYLTPEKKNELYLLKNYIDKNTRPNERIFVNYYSPLLYFLSDRMNASRYDYLNVPNNYQRATIKSLKSQKIRLVIMNQINKNENTLFAEYVRRNYHEVGKI